MGFRFRKSIGITKGIRLNISKKGIGVSAGVKGLRVSLGADGKTRVTASIPGTGISYQETLKQNSSTKTDKKYVPNMGEMPKNLIGDRDRIGYNGGDCFYSCSGTLNKYIMNGKRDMYYEKFANLNFFKAYLSGYEKLRNPEVYSYVVIEVTYLDSNTAAFTIYLNLNSDSEMVKLDRMIENKRLLFFKREVAKLRIQTINLSKEFDLGSIDAIFTMRDEMTVDQTIMQINNMRISDNRI